MSFLYQSHIDPHGFQLWSPRHHCGAAGQAQLGQDVALRQPYHLRKAKARGYPRGDAGVLGISRGYNYMYISVLYIYMTVCIYVCIYIFFYDYLYMYIYIFFGR